MSDDNNVTKFPKVKKPRAVSYSEEAYARAYAEGSARALKDIAENGFGLPDPMDAVKAIADLDIAKPDD